MNRKEILDEATRLIDNDRQADYGTPKENHDRIAKLWSVVLGITVEPWQVALCMNQVKVARLVQSPEKLDGWIDGAAYMAIGIPTTSLYFRGLGSSCNVLLRGPAGTFDYGSFPILNDNNKGIVTYGAGLGSKGRMNNGVLYNSIAGSLAIVNPIYSISFNGDAYYKKIYSMPTILNNNQLSRLTTL